MRIIFVFLFIAFAFQPQAQECNNAQHSVNINDSWISCDVTQNPNIDRGNTHWVMYDMGYMYSIGSTKFWNYNVLGETNKGMKNIAIDYSLNGVNWIEAATFQLGEASGDSNYEGEAGPNLGDIDARYILITSIDTWGGSCAGLSELRFDIEGTVPVNQVAATHQIIKLFPNPAAQRIIIDTEWDIKELIIVNSTGHELIRLSLTSYIDISFLPDGVYFLKSINHSNEVHTKRFIKQSR